mmetsp:Transcript_126405/g.316012  ORF Transcript_126405/g.316012 Transcript_126405/m.316012 type:complete len:736 (+) Transcript_126405:74-2281(+)
MLDDDALSCAGETLEKLAESPDWLLDPTAADAKNAADGVRDFIKLFFDAAQGYCTEAARRASDLGPGGLVVDGFDREQIWEELEVQNIPLRRHLRHRLARLSKAPKGSVELSLASSGLGAQAVADADIAASAPQRGKQKKLIEKDSEPATGKRRAKASTDKRKATRDGSEEEQNEYDDADEDVGKKKNGSKPAIGKDGEDGEDKFFSIEAMNKFADLAEGKMRIDEDAGDSDFDLLEVGDDDDDEDAEKAMFSDFFGDAGDEDASKSAAKSARQPKGKRRGEDVERQEEDSDEDAEEAEEECAVEGEEEEEEDEEGALGGDGEELSDEERELEKKIRELQKEAAPDGDDDDNDDNDSDVTGAASDDGEEDDQEGGKEGRKGKSLYDMDKRLRALEDEVAKLEEEQMEDRTWSMKGEVSGKQRPLNSLLEVHLDQPMSHFAGHRAEEAAAVGDGQTGEEDAPLEDLKGGDRIIRKFDVDAVIKQRIWDEAFDDVIRRAELPPSQRPQGADEDITETLNFEKSRVGLGDVYAKQYEAEMLGHKTEGEEKDDKEKAEAKALFAKLMFKLDLLTNAHFTPRPPMLSTSGENLAKVPSIKMEETIPLMVSEATLKAPEELRAPRRHEREQAELSHEERTAVRRAKKARRKKALQTRVEEGQMTLGGLRQREKALAEKNQEAKREKAARGTIKEQKKRLRASELLAQAAATVSGGASRKEEARKERQQRPEGAPSSKRLKL